MTTVDLQQRSTSSRRASRTLAETRAGGSEIEALDLERSIRAIYNAIEMGNHDALGEMFQPTAVYRRPGAAPILSRDRIVEFYRVTRSAATSRIIVENIVAQGQRAVALGLVEGRGKTGEPVHEQFADVYEFDDGLVRARTTYFYRHGF